MVELEVLVPCQLDSRMMVADFLLGLEMMESCFPLELEHEREMNNILMLEKTLSLF